MRFSTITIIALLINQIAFSQNECEKCNIDLIKDMSENLENPNIEIIDKFLCTFDNSCSNNVEFSEWSNEILYDFLEKHPDKLIERIENNNQLNKTELIDEIKGPILDENYDLILVKMDDLPDSRSRDKIILAIKIAKSFKFKFIPENANQKIQGNWKWTKEQGNFEISLEIKNGLIKGHYCGFPENLSKMDCKASDEAEECPITGIINENSMEILFTSCYSGETGLAKIELINDRLEWSTLDFPDGWNFVPLKCELNKL